MVCLLLKGKSEEEAIATCLSCPLPDCTLEKIPGKTVRKKVVPHVSGQLDIPVTSSIISPTDILSGTMRPSRLPESAGNGDWYSPKDIHFTREQMLWLISWLPSLVEGIYPSKTEYSGYVSIPTSQKTHSHHARFETPCQIAAEVEARLKLTGIEGKLLVAEVQGGKELEELQPESRRALNYITGWRRRRQSYSNWKKERKYRMQRQINEARGF